MSPTPRNVFQNNLNFGNCIAELVTKRNPFTWRYDPFINFDLDLIRNSLNKEKQKNSSSADRNLRQSLFSASRLPYIEAFISGSSKVPKGKVSQTREFRCELPIFLILYISGFAFSYSNEFRDILRNRFINKKQLPSRFLFSLHKIRKTVCGDILITPELDRTSNAVFILENPEFAGSVFDLEYLCTEEGVTTVIDIINGLMSHDTTFRYLKYDDRVSIPYLDNSFRTLETSLFVQSRDVEAHYVSTLAGHSINFSHPESALLYYDAGHLNAQLIQTTTATSISYFGTPTVRVPIVLFDYANYIFDSTTIVLQRKPSSRGDDLLLSDGQGDYLD